MSLPVFQLFVVVYVVASFYLLGVLIPVMAWDGQVSYQSYRISPLELVNGQKFPFGDAPVFGKAGLLWYGKPLDAGEAVIQKDGMDIILSFASNVTCNGIYFSSGPGMDALLPVNFLVSGSHTQGNVSTWELIPSSPNHVAINDAGVLQRNCTKTDQVDGMTRHQWTFPWDWHVTQILPDLVSGFGMMLVLFFSFRGEREMAARFFCMTMLGLSVSLTASVFSCGGADTITKILVGLECSLIPLAQVYCERKLLLAIFAMGVVDMFAVLNIYLQEGRVSKGNLIFGIVHLGLVISVTFARRRILQRSRALVLADQRKYDRLWSLLLQQPGIQNELIQLHEVVKGCKSRAKPRQLRSRRALNLRSERVSSDPKWKQTCYDTLIDESEDVEPNGSLGRLYVQASFLRHILVDKVQRIALIADGHFQCHEEDGQASLCKWSDVSNQEDLKRKIKFSGLKREGRAIEKIIRSYGNDPSWLVDICRQAIIFETVRDIVVALRAVMEDPELQVVRIKNRLDEEYDSNLSLGYRDCCVNLRMRTETTLKFGCDLHIAELQVWSSSPQESFCTGIEFRLHGLIVYLFAAANLSSCNNKH